VRGVRVGGRRLGRGQYVGRRPAAGRRAARQEGTVAAPLSHMQQRVQGQVLGERAHTHAHRRKAVHVHRVRQEFQAKSSPGQAPAHAHHARQTGAVAVVRRHPVRQGRRRRRVVFLYCHVARTLQEVNNRVTGPFSVRPGKNNIVIFRNS